MASGAAMRRAMVLVRHASSGVARTSTSVVGATAPKVLDNTVRLTAVHEVDGRRYALRGLVGQTLLRALVRSDLIEDKAHRLDDISACGAECEISVAGEWLQKLPARSDDEMHVLQKNAARGQDVDAHARLSCQIVLDRSLDGMAFAVPEARPWKSN